MTHDATLASRPAPGFGAVLSVAFGTTVAMWTLGFLSRLPAVAAPAPLLLALLLVCLVAGGFVAGRATLGGWRVGVRLGLTTAVVNLLVLGGLLAEAGSRLALLSLPGFLALLTLLAVAGSVWGSRAAPADGLNVDWPSTFARVSLGAAVALLAVGGMVTSMEAGLAVTDWPNTFGSNMFLYPLARMTGGVYFEHSHRLFGSLFGLTTLVLAVYLHVVESRRWVKRLALAVLLLVIVQGILGGLRVTGSPTLSTSPEDMAPSLPLAMVHGVFGQLVFGLLVALAVALRPAWRERRGAVRAASAGGDRLAAAVLLAALAVQLVLGAALRHFSWGLIPHITLAALVAAAVFACGIRGLVLSAEHPVLGRLGKALMAVVSVQLLLGTGALIALGLRLEGSAPGAGEVVLATAHQANGAILLAVAVAYLMWTFRLRRHGAAGQGMDDRAATS